jgi:acetate kinase
VGNAGGNVVLSRVMALTDHPILVVNAGSSSLKLALIDPATDELSCSVLLEALNTPQSILVLKPSGGEKVTRKIPGLSHRSGLDAALELLEETRGAPLELAGAGHRVVHGGQCFSSSQVMTAEVVEKIETCSDLAPLHNPWGLEGIRAVTELFPDLGQVAVFDTAFHQSIPRCAYLYAIPWELYEDQHFRRYGFHGTSFNYLTDETARILGQPRSATNLLCAHLGNGCSAAAVRDGHGVDTTMGITPLEGLVMGTRSGDVDPSLFLFLKQRKGFTVEQSIALLNRESGLLGLSGKSNDMREIVAGMEAGDERCEIALEVFCHRLARSLFGLAASLERIDALVFSGGIGENSTVVRERVLAQMSLLGMRIDPARNAVHGSPDRGRISSDDSLVPVFVIPTNEEAMIARETVATLGI